MTEPQTKNSSASRWLILAACCVAMLAIANLQYGWTLFTTDLTRSLHASLDAVQWDFTFFVIAQTMLFPLTGDLVDRFGPRIVVAGCAVLVGAGWIGAGVAHSLAALHLAYAIGGVGAGGVYGACIGVAIKWFPDRLYIMMVLVTASGLMMAAQLKPIGVTYHYDKYILLGGFTVFSITLTLNQVLNGSARPFFGWISDRIGRYDTMAIVFVIEAVTITLLTILVAHPVWFVVISGLMFFAWGDIYSLFPAAIADLFGIKYATTNYGIQYTSKGIGSILAGPGAAWLVEATNSWVPVFWVAVACNVTAATLAVFWLKPRVGLLVKPPIKEKAAAETVAP